MRNILVTGALGYIGSHTILKLLSKGYNVYGLSKSVESPILKALERFDNFYFLQADLKHYNEKLTQIDTVIHCAGHKSVLESWQEPQLYIKDNVRMTENLLNLVTPRTKKIIFISTAMVYADKKEPYHEEDSIEAKNPYSKCKIMQEEILRRYCDMRDISVTVLRCFNPIGVNPILKESISNCTTIVPAIARAIANEKRVSIYADNSLQADATAIRDYIHIEDLVNFICASIVSDGKKNYNIYNIGSGVGVSVQQLVREFEQIIGKSIAVEYFPPRMGESQCLVADIKKAIGDLKYKPQYTLQEACVSVLNKCNV